MEIDREHWKEVVDSAKGSARLTEALTLIKTVMETMETYEWVPEDFYECLERACGEIAFARSGLDGMTTYEDDWE